MSKNSDDERSAEAEKTAEVFAKYLAKRPLSTRSVMEIMRLGEKNWNNMPKQKKKEYLLKQMQPKEKQMRPAENPYAYEECAEYDYVDNEDLPKVESNICDECHKSRKRKHSSDRKKSSRKKRRTN